ncbi:MAG: TIGR02281 family clan AA aspartic protease [Sphingobium sp.]
MNNAQGADVLWYVLASTLVLSALLSRRFSLRGALGMALGWIAVFTIVLILFSYRNEFSTVADKVKSEVTGTANQRAEGQELHVRMSSDGHFWVDGEINGTAARFLIDSGATVTALSEETARNASLNVDMSGPGLAMQTANGTVVARRSSIPGLAIGPVRTSDLPVVVSSSFGGVNVLGMNFLSRLRSWRVENGEMVLEP